MGLSDVFDKYKHMDHLLSDSEWLPDSIQGQITYDLWQAVKEARAEEQKLLETALVALDEASSLLSTKEGGYAYQHEIEALHEALRQA